MAKSTSAKNDIPMFLAKLWNLVEDSKTNSLIRWSSNGSSFVVHDPATFAKHLLPQYFKHRNMASFVRVLNMYEFRKVIKLDSNSLKSTKDEMEFHHPDFRRGHEELLKDIKRKTAANKLKQIARRMSPGDALTNGSAAVHDPVKIPEHDLTVVLNDVKALRERQEAVDNQLLQLKQDNENMYNELQEMRRKHGQQQIVVNKLIEFFITLLNANGTTIRAAPSHLAIQDQTNLLNGTSPVKRPRLNDAAAALTSGTYQGPIIRDVTDFCSPAYSQQEPESDNWDFLQSNSSASRAQGQALRELSRAIASSTPGTSSVQPNNALSRPLDAQKFGVSPELLDIMIKFFSKPQINVAGPRYDDLVGSSVPPSLPSTSLQAAQNQVTALTNGSPRTSLLPQQSMPIAIPLNLTSQQILNILSSQPGLKEQLGIVDGSGTPMSTGEQQTTFGNYPLSVVPESVSGNSDSSVTSAQLAEQVDTMEANLDSIRDLLRSPTYQLDINQLVNLFPESAERWSSTVEVPVTQSSPWNFPHGIDNHGTLSGDEMSDDGLFGMNGNSNDGADGDDFLNVFDEDVPTDDLIEGVTIQIPDYPPSSVDDFTVIPLDNHFSVAAVPSKTPTSKPPPPVNKNKRKA